MQNALTNIITHVRHAPNLRSRHEGEGKYLIYCPKTDEMHIIGETEKQIFDLCADNSINAVVEEASALLNTGESAQGEIMAFIQALFSREILITPEQQNGVQNGAQNGTKS